MRKKTFFLPMRDYLQESDDSDYSYKIYIFVVGKNIYKL